eukprot:scaffold148341_cov31-Attheya_sp.AAC.1
MSAMIGLCPQWFMDETYIGRSNPNIKHMMSKYGLANGADATDRFLNSLSFLLKDNINSKDAADSHDVDCNRDAVNNFVNETERFSEHCTFEYFGNGICKIHFYDSSGRLSKTKVWEGPLLYQWSIGNDDVFPMNIFPSRVTTTGD